MGSFADMRLRCGHPLNMQLGRIEYSRLYSKLVGYLADRSVIVTTPPVSGDAFSIIEGDQFVCRAFSGRSAFAFKTHVLKVAPLPFSHLHLAYPQEVQSVVVRKATRVDTHLPAQFSGQAPAKEFSEDAMVLDISPAGACVAAAPKLAVAGDTVTVKMSRASDQQEMLLSAIVRSVNRDEVPKPHPPKTNGGAEDPAANVKSHYGLEFIEVTPDNSRAIQELIQQQLLDEI
jgi:c-di-GMP-binding flagellar brake protein YcgR